APPRRRFRGLGDPSACGAGRVRRAAGGHDRYEARALEPGQLLLQVVDLALAVAVGQRGPGHSRAVDQALAAPGGPGAGMGPPRRPARRQPPLVPAGVLGPGDLTRW